MNKVTTKKQRNKLSKRIKNTYDGKAAGNVPDGHDSIWLTISATTGEAHWDYTRQKVRDFIKQKGSEHFISPRKASLQPEYRN